MGLPILREEAKETMGTSCVTLMKTKSTRRMKTKGKGLPRYV